MTRIKVGEVEIGREHETQATIRAMRKNLIPFATTLLLAGAAGTASAGGSSGSVGVGVQQDLFGLGGPSVIYDGGMFHAGGYLGFADNRGNINGGDTTIDIGGQFFYHLHSTSMSDFGVGGQITYYNQNRPAPLDNFVGLYLDLGAQIRAFITSNVALSATLGLGIATADDDGVQLNGHILGTAGLHYYFF